jgi:nucleoid DNA-binding protein
LAIVKSKLLKQLANNYPNFLKKDLEKFTDIILTEIKQALKKHSLLATKNTTERINFASSKLGTDYPDFWIFK